LRSQFTAAVRARALDVASRTLRALRAHSVHVTATTLGELLAAASDADDCDAALLALSAVAERPGKPARLDEGTLLAALGAATRTRNVALADAAWAALEATAAARGAPPSAASYATLMASRAGRGDLEGAFRALAALQEAHGGDNLPPGALAPLVAACTGGPDALDAAYYTVERMRSSDQTTGVAALNVVIAACARAGDVGRAFETFEEIERTFGEAPTVASYNALLAACVWHGRAWAAPRMEEEMRAKGVVPDATTRALLLDAALAARDLPAAMARLADAVRDGESPPRDTLRRLLTHTRRAGDEPAREEVLRAMRGLGVAYARAPDASD
jgi:pentatricopeptide repeat protein